MREKYNECARPAARRTLRNPHLCTKRQRGVVKRAGRQAWVQIPAASQQHDFELDTQPSESHFPHLYNRDDTTGPTSCWTVYVTSLALGLDEGALSMFVFLMLKL